MTHVSRVIATPDTVLPGGDITVNVYIQPDIGSISFDVGVYYSRSLAGPWTLVARKGSTYVPSGEVLIEPPFVINIANEGVWYIGAKDFGEPIQNPQITDVVNVSAPLPSGYGKLSVATVPSGAAITIDGSSHGVAPNNNIVLTEGLHTVSVTLSGYETVTEQVNVQDGYPTTKMYYLAKTDSGILGFLVDNAIYFVVGGAALAALYFFTRPKK